MKYIDGFVAAVPTKNKAAYTRHVKQAAELLKKYGATKLVECWGDDIKEGKTTSFRKRSCAGTMRQWFFPGLNGLQKKFATKAWLGCWQIPK